MAAVGHALLAGEPPADGNGSQAASTSVRFTAVNGTHSLPTRTTSFRPDDTSPLGDHNQHLHPKQNGASDLYANKREPVGQPAEEHAATYSQPLNLSQSPPQQHIGKRKRSDDTASPSPPDISYPKVARFNGNDPAESAATQRSGRDVPRPHSYSTFEETNSKNGRPSWASPPSTGDGTAEGRLAEALQSGGDVQESQGIADDRDSPQELHADITRKTEDGSQPSGEATPPDAKKQNGRKRNFSQRTKTGCHTCRERKKKCDETKPVCNNCSRGSFTCKGYGPKSELDIRSAKPAPLQSKPAVQSNPRPGYYPPPTRPPTESWVNSQPIAVPTFDRTRPPAYEPDPAYAPARWPRPNGAERDHEVPYAHDAFSTSGYSRSDRSSLPSHYSSVFSSILGSNSTGDSSRTSISGHSSLSHVAALARMSEKDKMLAGKPYRHFSDPQLLEDRDHCRASLERFNNACRPSAGASPEERGRLFRAVVQPDRLLRMSRSGDPIGSVGSRTVVEAPFTCEYGYNLNIGDDVVIQAGCVVSDPCKIIIGSRTIIGPGVKLCGMTAPMDPKIRNGSQGVVYGGTITIEEDCFIGAGVTILPNRTIKKGSVVGAGTVVTKDVQRSTVVAGDPARVLRGVSGDDTHSVQIQAENDASIALMMADRFGNGKLAMGR